MPPPPPLLPPPGGGVRECDVELLQQITGKNGAPGPPGKEAGGTLAANKETAGALLSDQIGCWPGQGSTASSGFTGARGVSRMGSAG